MALTQVSQAMGGTGTSSVAAAANTSSVAAAIAANLTNTFGFKNRIINGDMRIAQRGTSATNPTANGYTTIDRLANWTHPSDTSSWTISQSTSAPTGFQYSALVNATNAAYTIGATTSYNAIYQAIEGVNCADLMWGTANAKTCTFSFWVNCSLTGTFSGYFYNNGYIYCYPFTYTIPTANIWTYITITVPGPAGGTWLTNTGLGIEVGLTLTSGSAYQGTANQWQTKGYAIGVANTVNVLATSGATFYTTGWQFEVGSQATNFDYRDYGRELIMCQRYYETFFGTAGAYLITTFQAISGSNVNGGGSFKVTKRASASIALIGNVYINGYNNGGAGTASISASASSVDSWGTMLTGASGLTAGNASGIYPANASSGFAFNAEIVN